MAPSVTCTCGECRKCRHRDYMRNYYVIHADKIRAIARRSREGRIDAVREYDRQRTRQRDPIKERARRAVTSARQRGDLTPQPCETCGSTDVQAHHDDYAKPLIVRWLCRAHHMELHRVHR